MQQRFRNPEATRFANKVVFLLEREFARPIRPQYELRRTTLPLDPSFATEPRGPSLRRNPRNLTRLRGTQCPAVKEPHVPIAQPWGIFFPRCPGERSRGPNRVPPQNICHRCNAATREPALIRAKLTVVIW